MNVWGCEKVLQWENKHYALLIRVVGQSEYATAADTHGGSAAVVYNVVRTINAVSYVMVAR